MSSCHSAKRLLGIISLLQPTYDALADIISPYFSMIKFTYLADEVIHPKSHTRVSGRTGFETEPYLIIQLFLRIKRFTNVFLLGK